MSLNGAVGAVVSISTEGRVTVDLGAVIGLKSIKIVNLRDLTARKRLRPGHMDSANEPPIKRAMSEAGDPSRQAPAPYNSFRYDSSMDFCDEGDVCLYMYKLDSYLFSF